MKQPKRYIAFVTASYTGAGRQLVGLPPELTGGKDRREPLPAPRALIIEEKAGGFYLYRFSEGGEFAGDTWHGSLAAAKQQAAFEGKLTEWRFVPEHVQDAAEYAQQLLASEGGVAQDE